jgi:hypothetical protein
MLATASVVKEDTSQFEADKLPLEGITCQKYVVFKDKELVLNDVPV